MKMNTDLILTANPSWSVAVFAYNEAQLIRDTLESIEAAVAGHPIEITILANGCKDATGNLPI
jgi:glycosyltransferase involved in cell wall biosynthesis